MTDSARHSGSDSQSGISDKRTEGVSRAPLSSAESEFARELFERYRLSLRRYLTGLVPTREDANEILQETFLRLLRQPSFDQLRENARAYLFQTATNLARDLFRQKVLKGTPVDIGEFAEGGLDASNWTNWPELALQGEQVGAVITSALGELDNQVRAALLLHRFREMTHRQVAVRLGVSERTIERYIKEGLTHIARRLKEEL